MKYFKAIFTHARTLVWFIVSVLLIAIIVVAGVLSETFRFSGASPSSALVLRQLPPNVQLPRDKLKPAENSLSMSTNSAKPKDVVISAKPKSR